MFGLKADCILDIPQKYYSLSDYEGKVARWCPGCGDHGVLTAALKVCRDKQLPPEKVVCVSGIGCSSRFPHYMSSYGFHGLHGRAFPVACGVKFRRPDLKVFVATGDGDCCSIGTAHWIHAIRYNMDLTVMLMDNEIYGLTKKQTSPTSPPGTISNTHPKGSFLPPINPLVTTLSVNNVSFVAQTADWLPAHVYATLLKAYEHPGFAFVRILQRCPNMNKDCYTGVMEPAKTALIHHPNGINVDEAFFKAYKGNAIEHDPSDINRGRELAGMQDMVPIGLFFQDTQRPRYDEYGAHNLNATIEEREANLNREFDRYAV
jgi:2-oxoglutarate ferredoxin oxidoreductase subunit beta